MLRIWKEFFQFGQTVTDGDVVAGEYPPNVAVMEVPAFTPTLLHAYRQFEKTGAALLEAIAIYPGIREQYFGQFTTRPLRSYQNRPSLRYSMKISISSHYWWERAQKACKSWTVRGSGFLVTSLPGQIAVNAGDMLQRMSNNKLWSTTHRVVNPPREYWGTSRFSTLSSCNLKAVWVLPACKIASMPIIPKRIPILPPESTRMSAWVN